MTESGHQMTALMKLPEPTDEKKKTIKIKKTKLRGLQLVASSVVLMGINTDKTL